MNLNAQLDVAQKPISHSAVPIEKTSTALDAVEGYMVLIANGVEYFHGAAIISSAYLTAITGESNL